MAPLLGLRRRRQALQGRSVRDLQSFALVERTRRIGDKTSVERRYYISSLAPDAEKLMRAVRSHWEVENRLHWCLDVTFREDESRLRNRIAGDNVAWLKRFAIGLLKQVDSKESIAMRRRIAGWNDDFLLQVLGIKGS